MRYLNKHLLSEQTLLLQDRPSFFLRKAGYYYFKQLDLRLHPWEVSRGRQRI